LIDEPAKIPRPDSERVLATNQSNNAIDIREFIPGDEVAFRQLNEEWITRHFQLKAKDEELFDDPQGVILAKGGRIFIVIREGRPVGCCVLVAIRPGEYEVAKMGVTPSAQGLGIGRKMLERVIEEAKIAGASRLYLETNPKLAPAIRLYESVGFQHVPPERIVPSPYARAEVPMELYFPFGS